MARRRRGSRSSAPRARSASRSSGSVGVVDVGGGSTELAIGTLAGGATWSESFRVGSGLLTDGYRRADPPSAAELHAMREHAHGVFEGLDLPPVDAAVAVGGSAASLRRLVGAVLDGDSLQRALRVLAEEPAEAVARRFSIDRERVLLMPAGLTVLDAAAAAASGARCEIGRGGLREGVILELAGGRHRPLVSSTVEEAEGALRSTSRIPRLYFNRELSWLEFNQRVHRAGRGPRRARCWSG